jgi:hypothetical protein
MRYRNRFLRSRQPDPLGIALLLSIGALAGAAATYWVSRRERPMPKANGSDSAHERRLDDALNGTYPASDPPASHYTDIPANRR